MRYCISKALSIKLVEGGVSINMEMFRFYENITRREKKFCEDGVGLW